MSGFDGHALCYYMQALPAASCCPSEERCCGRRRGPEAGAGLSVRS